MKSLTGRFSSVRGWALLFALFLAAGGILTACGEEETPTPTTPAPTPTPTPEPEPEPEPEGPATPGNLQVTDMTPTSITWSWDAVEGAAGYQTEFSVDDDFADGNQSIGIHLATQLSRTVSNAARGYLRVRAAAGEVNDLTYSDWSDPVMGAALEPTQLSVPGRLGVDESRTSVTLTWSAVTDADQYEVEQSADGGAWVDADCGETGRNMVDGTECVASGLTAGTDYDFRVRAVPASGDTANAASDWAEVQARTTGTSGPVSGGMGSLNVTWTATDDDIIWNWEPMAGATYQWTVTADTVYDDRENPCAGVDWESPNGSGAEFSYDLPGQAVGQARLLCVQNEGGENLSYAWAAVAQGAPTPNGITPVGNDGSATTAVRWMSIGLTGGFDYEMRVVADPVMENAIDGNNTSATAIQQHCDAGTLHEQGNTDVTLPAQIATEFTSVAPHTGYLLCLRQSNDSGATAWVVPTDNVEVTTVPGMVSRPTFNSALSSQGDTTETVVWDVETRGETHVPREATGYNLSTIRYPVQADLDNDGNLETVRAPTQADCSASAATNAGADEQFTIEVGATRVLTTSGFRVTTTPTRPVSTDPNQRIHLCVQAMNGTNLLGPWQISTQVTIENQPE